MDTHVSNYLAKYQKLAPPDRKTREAVQQIVKRLLGIDLLDASVKFERGIIFLAVHPIVKRRILDSEREVLQEIEEMLSKKVVRALR